jgi:hypothetical protein
VSNTLAPVVQQLIAQESMAFPATWPLAAKLVTS